MSPRIFRNRHWSVFAIVAGLWIVSCSPKGYHGSVINPKLADDPSFTGGVGTSQRPFTGGSQDRLLQEYKKQVDTTDSETGRANIQLADQIRDFWFQVDGEAQADASLRTTVLLRSAGSETEFQVEFQSQLRANSNSQYPYETGLVRSADQRFGMELFCHDSACDVMSGFFHDREGTTKAALIQRKKTAQVIVRRTARDGHLDNLTQRLVTLKKSDILVLTKEVAWGASHVRVQLGNVLCLDSSLYSTREGTLDAQCEDQPKIAGLQSIRMIGNNRSGSWLFHIQGTTDAKLILEVRSEDRRPITDVAPASNGTDSDERDSNVEDRPIPEGRVELPAPVEPDPQPTAPPLQETPQERPAPTATPTPTPSPTPAPASNQERPVPDSQASVENSEPETSSTQVETTPESPPSTSEQQPDQVETTPSKDDFSSPQQMSEPAVVIVDESPEDAVIEDRPQTPVFDYWISVNRADPIIQVLDQDVTKWDTQGMIARLVEYFLEDDIDRNTSREITDTLTGTDGTYWPQRIQNYITGLVPRLREILPHFNWRGVPQPFLFVTLWESNYFVNNPENPYSTTQPYPVSVSSAGAVGPYQLMYNTALRLELIPGLPMVVHETGANRQPHQCDMRGNLRTASLGITDLWKKLLQQWPNNPHFAVLDYYMGMSNVKNLVEACNGYENQSCYSYNEMREYAQDLTKAGYNYWVIETYEMNYLDPRHYVRRFLAAYHILTAVFEDRENYIANLKSRFDPILEKTTGGTLEPDFQFVVPDPSTESYVDERGKGCDWYDPNWYTPPEY